MSTAEDDMDGEGQKKGLLTAGGRDQIQDQLEHLQLAGESHMVGPDQVKSLLTIMQVPQQHKLGVMEKIFQGSEEAALSDVVDCISETTQWGDQEMEVLLHRVGVFQQAFQKVDIDDSGTLTLKEVFLMMETLGVDKSFAADLMAFLDDDGSGEISWAEFVEGISSPEFKKKFPHVTLEAICTMPSCMDGNKFVSPEEQEAALSDLPTVEYFMYWVLTRVYGRGDGAKVEKAPANTPTSLESSDSDFLPPGSSPTLDNSLKDAREDIEAPPVMMPESPKDEPMPPLPLALSSSTTLPHQLWMHDTDPDLSCTWQTVETEKKRKLVVVTKTQPRNPSAVLTGVVAPKGMGKQNMVTIAETQRMLQSWQAEYELSIKGPPAELVETVETGMAWASPKFSSESVTPGSTKRLHKSVSAIQAMKVEETKAHVLNERKRLKVWGCIYAAVFGGVVAGVVAALMSQALNDFVGGIWDPEEQMIEYNVGAGLLSCIWSVAEMMICCVAAISAAAKMTAVCGIVLVPMDRERAMLAGSLARSALELGHPQGKFFGVNPHKKVSKNLLLIHTVLYMSSRGATKFIVKMVLKKIAPRTAIKFLEFAALWVELALNVIFNYLTVRFAMSEVMLCCLGPSAAVEVTSQLIKARHERLILDDSELRTKPLPDLVKRCCLRAVGICITTTMSLHPNTRHLLQHLGMLFVDDGFLRRSLDDLRENGLAERLAVARSSKSMRRSSFKESLSNLSVQDKKTSLDYMCCCCANWLKQKIRNWTNLEELSTGLESHGVEGLGLDDEDIFFAELEGLQHDHDFNLVLSMLVLGFLLDGRLSGKEWKLIVQGCRKRNPPQDPSRAAMSALMRKYQDGSPMCADDFLAVVSPDSEDEVGGLFCSYLNVQLRALSSYLNVF